MKANMKAMNGVSANKAAADKAAADTAAETAPTPVKAKDSPDRPAHPLTPGIAAMTPPKGDYQPDFSQQHYKKQRDFSPSRAAQHPIGPNPSGEGVKGPTVGLDSFLIQNSTKNQGVVSASTRRGRAYDGSAPKVGNDSFMLSEVRKNKEQRFENATSPGLLRGYSAHGGDSLMHNFVHGQTDARREGSPTKPRNPFNLAGGLKPATISIDDMAVRVTRTIPTIPHRRGGAPFPQPDAAKPNVGVDNFMNSHLKSMKAFNKKGGSREVRL